MSRPPEVCMRSYVSPEELDGRRSARGQPGQPPRSSLLLQPGCARSSAVPGPYPGAGTGGCTHGRLYPLEAGRHRVPASLLAVLSALGNVGLMFLGFFPSPLGVYISKKWLTVNIRFHLHFWEESDTEVFSVALLMWVQV